LKIESGNAVGTTGRFLGAIKPKGATTEKFTEIYHTLVLDEWSEKNGGAYADLCYPVPKGHKLDFMDVVVDSDVQLSFLSSFKTYQMIDL